MADARRLQTRAGRAPLEFSEDAQEREVPLIRLDCAMWTAPHFCRPETPGDGYNAQSGSSDSDLHGDDDPQIIRPESPQ
jgi:hypothetical protein